MTCERSEFVTNAYEDTANVAKFERLSNISILAKAQDSRKKDDDDPSNEDLDPIIAHASDRNGQFNEDGQLTIMKTTVQRGSRNPLNRLSRVKSSTSENGKNKEDEFLSISCRETFDKIVASSVNGNQFSFHDGALRKPTCEEDDELSEVEPSLVPSEVREWLASTFTRQTETLKRRSEDKPRFRSVANAIRAGIFVDRIYRRMSSSVGPQIPANVVPLLKSMDNWSFDIFAVNDAANGHCLRYIGYELLNRYGLIHKFKMQMAQLENFLTAIESGYCKNKNPYHNNIHAADVTQTVHYMVCKTGIGNWLTDLEMLSVLTAAIIHDFEHNGTTNNFHVMSGSSTALLYNDRAVLENHHISSAFRLLIEDENNFLSHLSTQEYRDFRSLVIEMVLSTDMSSHFLQIKTMKSLLSRPIELRSSENSMEKSKVLSLILHCSDISHPSKEWNLHHRWTMSLLEEFFQQGDKEKELGLPYSPLCDRKSTLVAESQIGFIDFIVDPSMQVCGDMLDRVLATMAKEAEKPEPAERNHSASSLPAKSAQNLSSVTKFGSVPNSPRAPLNKPPAKVTRPWEACLVVNKKLWTEKARQDAALRAEKEKTEKEKEDSPFIIVEDKEEDKPET
ncbi:Calcium/calmodulin-dependent 3',5'-cyclic nucleotide phosphodiesterase 1 [Nymphon striatum]|nr:Calcium/calmodulin-dependent 3',5'-cyclic nucleotide phosphodiesterase 1 [Nymphon striatum]